MNITISSIFRNSSSYVDRYFKQLSMLRDLIEARGHTVSLVLVEGDSTDDTFEQLKLGMINYGFTGSVLNFNHGGPLFGSIENGTRWTNISKVCNHLLANIPKSDIVVYVESDLLWTPDTIMTLIDDTEKYDAVAPMCFHLPTGLFYDTWGHRRNGVRFEQRSPYHPDIDLTDTHGRLEIDSAGSCIVMNGDVAALARFLPLEQGIVGFCHDLHQWGFKLWLNPHQRVFHP